MRINLRSPKKLKIVDKIKDGSYFIINNIHEFYIMKYALETQNYHAPSHYNKCKRINIYNTSISGITICTSSCDDCTITKCRQRNIVKQEICEST